LAQALRCDLQAGAHVRVSEIVEPGADALTSRISLTYARLAAIVARAIPNRCEVRALDQRIGNQFSA